MGGGGAPRRGGGGERRRGPPPPPGGGGGGGGGGAGWRPDREKPPPGSVLRTSPPSRPRYARGEGEARVSPGLASRNSAVISCRIGAPAGGPPARAPQEENARASPAPPPIRLPSS